jgi:hypothetical protein
MYRAGCGVRRQLEWKVFSIFKTWRAILRPNQSVEEQVRDPGVS